MDGAANYDFLRQPDFVPNDILKGSYAIYKKDVFVGQGTGKLCHLNRPEIIDTRGRRCWGELSIVENELRIMIPEWWLSEAKYPVLIDPVVGTMTIGSYARYDMEYHTNSSAYIQMIKRISTNVFILPERISGVCTAYAYANSGDIDMGGRGVVFAESSGRPAGKMSSNEQLIDLQVISESKPAGWRSGTFYMYNMSDGVSVWFGISSENSWSPRYDFGKICYAENWINTSTPSSYPSPITYTYDLKLSMYFTYTANLMRDLTQGVSLNDSHNRKTDYNRLTEQTAGVTSNIASITTFFRECIETLVASSVIEHFRSLNRRLTEQTTAVTSTLRSITTFLRAIAESMAVTHTNQHYGEYHRELKSTSDNFEGIEHEGKYYRRNTETIRPVSSLFRSLLLFIKIITQVFIRDYLLTRFLKARSEIVIKSCVTREIILESKIA